MKLPNVVVSYLAEQMIARRSIACVRVTVEGKCVRAEGALALYGLAELKRGDSVCDRISFLTDYLPIYNHAEVLPQISLREDLIVDVHLIPSKPATRFSPRAALSKSASEQHSEGGWIVFLDTTAETRKQQSLQQQGNELSLIRHQQRRQLANVAQRSSPSDNRLEISQSIGLLSQVSYQERVGSLQLLLSEEDGSLLSHLVGALNLAILECLAPSEAHRLSAIGQVPNWITQCFDCFRTSTGSIPAELFSPFLDNFLYDAAAVWQQPGSEPLRSGVWTETVRLNDENNETTEEEVYLEAIALSLNRRNIILIERLDIEQSDKFQWLQTARQEQLEFINERKETAKKILQAESYDSLTGLPNRSLFFSELESFFEESKQFDAHRFALIVLDIDRFQLLNNSLGSDVGDQLLVAIANRIQSCLRQFDVPVRFSSDEFGILLGQIETRESAENITQRLLESINQPFIINGAKTYFTASAGLVLSGSWYHYSRDILRDAQLALREAKVKQRGRYVVFERDMRTRAFELWNLESALDTAIEKNELVLFYQPIVNLKNNKVEGFEALIRWKHPQQGYISPAKFIPLAEESGHIIDIDNWVLRTACHAIQDWQQNTGHTVCLNVNVSPLHLGHGGLYDVVLSALQQAHVVPSAICLEITESCLLSDTQTVTRTLNQLKALGVQVAIDDFGTGYASLGYLQDLPLDKLKIDGYFVEMMKSSGSDIVNTVVQLAHRLNFNVTAERVETAEQYKVLRQLDCDMGQGYLFSKPLPFEDAQSFIGAQVVIPRVKDR